jgi:hypothetical protein
MVGSREMDGLGSPEGLMDPSMMDLRYQTPGCHSPILSYQPFQPASRPGELTHSLYLHAITLLHAPSLYVYYLLSSPCVLELEFRRKKSSFPDFLASLGYQLRCEPAEITLIHMNISLESRS